MGGGQLLSQALLIYRWITSPCPCKCLHLYSSRYDGPSTQGTPGQGARDHSTGLKSQRRCSSLPAGQSREGLPEARAHARHRLAGLGRKNGPRPWLCSLIPLGAGPWVGACVLLITQVNRVDSWSVRHADDTYYLISKRTTDREEFGVGTNFLWIIGSRMNSVDCFLPCCRCAKGHYWGFHSLLPSVSLGSGSQPWLGSRGPGWSRSQEMTGLWCGFGASLGKA